jgi:hypothetical protein
MALPHQPTLPGDSPMLTASKPRSALTTDSEPLPNAAQNDAGPFAVRTGERAAPACRWSVDPLTGALRSRWTPGTRA